MEPEEPRVERATQPDQVEADAAPGRQPWESPRLVEYGTVEELTEGVPILPLFDIGGLSFI